MCLLKYDRDQIWFSLIQVVTWGMIAGLMYILIYKSENASVGFLLGSVKSCFSFTRGKEKFKRVSCVQQEV